MTANGLILLGVTIVVAVILYVWTAIALSAVFRKAGEAGGKAWVPFLNAAVVLRLGGFSGWLVLIVLVPLFGALLLGVSLIVAAHNINRSFGLGGGMTVLAALLFPVWASVVGFGSARWLSADEGWGPVRSNETVALPFALDDPQRERTSSLLDGPRPYPGDGLTVMPLPPEPVFGAAAAGPAWLDTPPVPPAQEPSSAVSEVSSWFRPGEESEPFPPPVRPVPAPELSEILRAPDPYAATEDDAFPESSGAVSAVFDAPRAGAPRSARQSVSAQQESSAAQDEAALLELVQDETVLTRRRRVGWMLHPAGGAPIPLTSERIIVGRRPAPDPLQPDAQLVSIPDPTRTVSKTHALLRRRGDTWFVTDLDSTNGVLFATVMGAEVEAEPGVEVEAGERFLLGDLEVRIAREP